MQCTSIQRLFAIPSASVGALDSLHHTTNACKAGRWPLAAEFRPVSRMQSRTWHRMNQFMLHLHVAGDGCRPEGPPRQWRWRRREPPCRQCSALLVAAARQGDRHGMTGHDRQPAVVQNVEKKGWCRTAHQLPHEGKLGRCGCKIAHTYSTHNSTTVSPSTQAVSRQTWHLCAPRRLRPAAGDA